MNIAVFADVHGRILLALKLCARWQRETGEQLDLILQAGDLGTFPDLARVDSATRRHADRDPSELGFLEYFVTPHPEVEAVLEELRCDLVYVRGNHEDQEWLDHLEQQASGPIFPVDPYQRLWCLKTGVPYTFEANDERVTILGVGRIGAPPDPKRDKPIYLQPYERKRLNRLTDVSFDVLLTHDSARNQVFSGSGIDEIGLLIDLYQPNYHFFGHYDLMRLSQTAANGVTRQEKLVDLIWDRHDRGHALEANSMGLLRWHSREEHSFEVIDAPWFQEYTPHTWTHL
jgi:hypothetical protein